MNRALLGCLAVLSCAREPVGAAAAEGFPVEGRVTDEHGAGLAGVDVTFTDTLHRSGYVDPQGCGTYYPQERLRTDDEGRFSARLPFQPTEVVASGQLPWLRFSREPWRVTPGALIELEATSIPHHEVHGLVVDESGQPIAGALIELPQVRTDAQGRFSAEVPDSAGDETRVRRMGFRPLVVPMTALERVVLPRRSLVTVTLLDEPGGAPVSGLRQVSLWREGERQSFCTAGEARLTHEPNEGECTLDAEPGTVELRVDGVPLKTLSVTAAPQAVQLRLAPPAPGR